MSNVSPLKNANAEPVEEVIDVLEGALKMAKTGELRSIVLVGDCTGNLIWRHCAMKDRTTLLGHLSHAAFTVNAADDF